MNCPWAILVILALTAGPLYGQEVAKCDMEVLLHTSKRTGQLRQDGMSEFLRTFDVSCRRNAEYTEWSREILFDLLQKQTELVLRTLEREERRIDTEVILEELASPLKDFDFDGLIGKVEKIKISEQLKADVLESLETARRRAQD